MKTASRPLCLQGGFAGFDALLAALVVFGGVLLAFSITQRLGQLARARRVSAEIHTLSQALETFHRELGRWPADALEGEAPAGIAQFLHGENWPAATPLGGRYVWTAPTGGEPGTLGVTAFGSDAPFDISRAELRAIDARLDDGNLATGRLRLGFNDWPVWLVGP